MVDSEVMLAALARSGFGVGGSLDGADVAVVNTCSFLESAREEARQWIEEALRLKRAGKLKAVMVAGCLPALEGRALFEEYPELDAIVGPRDRLKLAQACAQAVDGPPGKRSFLGGTDALVRAFPPRAVSTGRHSAYLKISEGCDNRCAYCLIPSIRGSLVSRSVPSLLREAALLAGSGVRELCVIAQDTTAYGVDLYGRPSLHGLLEGLSETPGIAWVRLLYTHPAHWYPELIQVLRNHPRLCKYADVPVQHVSERMLRLMGRRLGRKRLLDTLARLRNTVPGISLRTTVMVGFPGETEREFAELLDFLGEFKFEHVGAFSYSREAGTRAATLPGQLSESTKEERLRRVMEVQRGISRKKNAALVGKKLRVLLDKASDGGARAVGRTEGQAPEVDGVVRVKGDGLRVGEFYDVKVTGFGDYDLTGLLVSHEQARRA